MLTKHELLEDLSLVYKWSISISCNTKLFIEMVGDDKFIVYVDDVCTFAGNLLDLRWFCKTRQVQISDDDRGIIGYNCVCEKFGDFIESLK
ncbi:hypothetical protein VP14_067 [Vibrio phage VPMCC14]|nr:hypothetical protein VP14_067 [Vibrio phage VPMCC14]